MGDSRQQIPMDSAATLGRRKFLFTAAAVGTVAWAVPTIITMEPAGAAALTSPPPEPPVDPVDPVVQVRGAVASGEPGSTSTAAPAAGTTASQAELPRTGVEPTNLLAAGLAATAGGAAMLLWSADAGTSSGSVAESERWTARSTPPTG